MGGVRKLGLYFFVCLYYDFTVYICFLPDRYKEVYHDSHRIQLSYTLEIYFLISHELKSYMYNYIYPKKM